MLTDRQVRTSSTTRSRPREQLPASSKQRLRFDGTYFSQKCDDHAERLRARRPRADPDLRHGRRPAPRSQNSFAASRPKRRPERPVRDEPAEFSNRPHANPATRSRSATCGRSRATTSSRCSTRVPADTSTRRSRRSASSCCSACSAAPCSRCSPASRGRAGDAADHRADRRRARDRAHPRPEPAAPPPRGRRRGRRAGAHAGGDAAALDAAQPTRRRCSSASASSSPTRRTSCARR